MTRGAIFLATAENVQWAIQDVLLGEGEPPEQLQSVDTFEERGVMTNDAGLVLRFTDGSEWQLTVVRSR